MSKIKTKFIADNAVDNTKLAQVSTQTLKGRTTAGTGNVEDLTATQATAILNVFGADVGSGGVKGLVPATVAGDAAKYLKGDGTWATIAISGDISPTTWSGLANNTANQTITGLSFASTISSFDCLMNIFIDATADTYTTIKITGTRMATSDWSVNDCEVEYTGDTITGLDFNITSAGQVRISIGNITGFSSGSVKFRAITLS